MKTVGVTIGEPLGIGPEIIVRSLSKGAPKGFAVRLYGNESVLSQAAAQFKIKPFWTQPSKRVTIVPTGPEPPHGGFSLSDRNLRAQAVLASLNRASDDVLSGEISALVTAPIDKSVVRTLMPKFTGHTAYLGERAGVENTFMLLDNGEIRVVLLTEHIPLRDVSRALTHGVVEQAIRIASEGFRKWSGQGTLRVAILGLNPHAGEITERSEEEFVLRPVIEKMKGKTLFLEGPFSADSFFPLARKGGWDFILSAYHDQGLIAVKYAGLHKVVNITLGLPYLRVSPGHGTAYDIAGKGIADVRGFVRALKIAGSGKIA